MGTYVDADVDAEGEGGGAHCDAAGGGEEEVVPENGALEDDEGADIAGKK